MLMKMRYHFFPSIGGRIRNVFFRPVAHESVACLWIDDCIGVMVGKRVDVLGGDRRVVPAEE